MTDEARALAETLLETARTVGDADTSATLAPVVITAATDGRRSRRNRRSGRSSSRGSRRGDANDDSHDYVGDTPEEIEATFHDLAGDLADTADEVIEYIDDTIY